MQPHQQPLTERRVRATELAREQVTALPARAALSLVNANLAAPINAALALNALSDGAVAAAGARQTAPVDQGALTGPLSLS